MLGSGWRTLEIIKVLEQDLQVPVVHPVTARVWEIQKRLHVREPRKGFGHLLGSVAVRLETRPWPTVPGGATDAHFHASRGVLAAADRRQQRDTTAAQSVEHFYKGRTVTMLVGTAPGGINDISARLVARHLGRFIPGNPNIVVQNNPGGGGLVTANRLYFNSEKDGTVLAKLERAVPQLAIQGNPNAQFDPAKFIWLGSMSSYADDAYLMTHQWPTSRSRSIARLKTGGDKSITLGADQCASSNLIFAVIAKEVLGLNVNVVRGYTGAAPHVPGHAARRARWPDRGLELGPYRPARSLEQKCVSAAHGVSGAPGGTRNFRTFRSAAS